MDRRSLPYVRDGNSNGSLAEWRGSGLLIRTRQVRLLQGPPIQIYTAVTQLESECRASNAEDAGSSPAGGTNLLTTSNSAGNGRQNSSCNTLSAGEALEFLSGAFFPLLKVRMPRCGSDGYTRV